MPIRGDEGAQIWVKPIVAEKKGCDAIRDAQRTAEERTVWIVDLKQPTADQRARARKARPVVRYGRRQARQLKGQADRCSAPADIVVEVAIKALKARIDVRRQGDQQELDIEAVEAECPSQAAKRKPCVGSIDGVGPRLDSSYLLVQRKIGG